MAVRSPTLSVDDQDYYPLHEEDDVPEIPPHEERLRILLRERPDPKKDDEKSGKTFILVSGLPRSGTSLMMQMLEAGGVKTLTDSERVSDVDNPKGYYEWEPIKQIGKKPELLDEEALDGLAVSAKIWCAL